MRCSLKTYLVWPSEAMIKVKSLASQAWVQRYRYLSIESLNNIINLFELWIQISEAMDIRTRQGLLNALAEKVGKRMDTLLVPLELLCCISRTEFSDKKAYIRWQKRQVLLFISFINFITSMLSFSRASFIMFYS